MRQRERRAGESVFPVQALWREKIVFTGAGRSPLARIERVQALRSLMDTKTWKNLFSYNMDYAEVPIKENSVIYCDIPYKGTKEYEGPFDYERFYWWCEKQTQPLFISSYEMPSDQFVCIGQKERRGHYSAQNNCHYVTEKVFRPIHQVK